MIGELLGGADVNSFVWMMEPTTLQRWKHVQAQRDRVWLDRKRQSQWMPAAAALEYRLARAKCGPGTTNGAGLVKAAAQLGLLHVSGRVAQVPIRGVMIKGIGPDAGDYGAVDTRLVRFAVDAAALDPEIASVLLVIDTPGGSVDGIAELADAIYAARQNKPVRAQVDGMMASAGFYVGSQAETIAAQRMDLIGSVGAAIRLYDYSGLFQDLGIEAVPIDTSPYKSTGMMGTKITGPQRDYLGELVDGIFADFLRMVRRGRGATMTAVDLEHISDARLHIAPHARALGMIDTVQTLEETLAAMRAQVADPMSLGADRAVRRTENARLQLARRELDLAQMRR